MKSNSTCSRNRAAAKPPIPGLVTLLVAQSLASPWGIGASVVPRLDEVARAAPRPPGAPTYSDVCFTSRWKRENTFEMLRAFHATRLDWCYVGIGTWNGQRDPEPFVAEARRLGVHVGLTLPVNARSPEGWMIMTNSKPYIPRWYSWVNPDRPANLPGCVNRPAFREEYLAAGLQAVALGADVLHKDDSSQNFYAAVHSGACVCRHCAERARAAGVDLHNPLQRVAFARDSTIAFYRELHEKIDARAGRHVPVSENAGWTKARGMTNGHLINALFDYEMTEFPLTFFTPATLWAKSREARAAGRAVILTTNHKPSVPEYRRMIAATYATGMHLLAPWDQWMHGGTNRYFGAPADFADLFGLVRAGAEYLDGYEDAAVYFPGGTDERWPEPPVRVEGGSGHLAAFTRARPSQTNAPVVIHLVDWGEPQPARLALNCRAFFGNAALVATLLTPATYDAPAHAAAENRAEQLRPPGQRRGAAQASAYAPLVHKRPLTVSGGDVGWVELPAITPWALLVVSPARSNPTHRAGSSP